MKSLEFTPETIAKVTALEKERQLSKLCVDFKVCPHCAGDLTFDNEYSIHHLTCSNCDTAYDFGKYEWILKSEIK